MDIKDYQKLGGYQYAYETETVIKKNNTTRRVFYNRFF